uniref:Uncharacterized protein n=1 Tax=Anguilla anguilla TaxID=7936 RepID=A0A0E9R197_ANGAN
MWASYIIQDNQAIRPQNHWSPLAYFTHSVSGEEPTDKRLTDVCTIEQCKLIFQICCPIIFMLTR